MTTTATINPHSISIREARPSDDAALRRLAELDGGQIPSGRILLGEVDGELRAALPIAGGPAITDPFRPTEELIAQMREHAEHLQRRPQPRLSTRIWLQWPKDAMATRLGGGFFVRPAA